MRRLVEYFRQVRCKHEYLEINDTVKRWEDERACGVRSYEYNRKRKICKHCNYIRSETLASTPNNI